MSILMALVAANIGATFSGGVFLQVQSNKIEALRAALKDMGTTSQRDRDKLFNEVKQNVTHRRQHAKLLTSLNQQIVDLQKEMLKSPAVTKEFNRKIGLLTIRVQKLEQEEKK